MSYRSLSLLFGSGRQALITLPSNLENASGYNSTRAKSLPVWYFENINKHFRVFCNYYGINIYMEFFLQPTFPEQRSRFKVWVDNNSFYFSPQPCRLLFGFELDRLVPEMWLSSFGSRFFQNAVMKLVSLIVSIEIDHLQRKTVETIIMTRFRSRGDVCLEIPSLFKF